MSTRSVLITDVDNTLLDWVELWHATFSAMLERLVQLSTVNRDELLDEIRLVHQRHRTSEYAFLVEEVPSLRAAAGSESVSTFYKDAIAEYRRVRNAVLQLYPGVLEFLTMLQNKGVLIIAYTESLAFYTEYRFRKLGLDQVVDYLYSPADHDLPEGVSINALRHYPASHYKMTLTQHHHTPAGETKPNPGILLEILKAVGAEPEQAVYVGDSLLKDVSMAQQAGVLDVYAAYGAAQHTQAYDLLKRVTHWPDQDVQREQSSLEINAVTASITLEHRFDDLLNHVEFVSFERKSS